jgi:hypothetical protein
MHGRKGRGIQMSARSITDLIKMSLRSISVCGQFKRKSRKETLNVHQWGVVKKRNIPKRHYRNLCVTFESFIQINQLNGTVRQCAPKKVGHCLHMVVYGTMDMENTGKYWKILLSRVLCDTATDLNKANGQNTENKRIRWTNDERYFYHYAINT